MRNFRSLKIWEEGIAIVKQIYKLAKKLPVEEKYGLKSQVCQSAVSIPSNIAEGCSRNSDKEFKRFLEIAIGSSFELETQLLIIQELAFVSTEEVESIIERLHTEQKMINNLHSKLKANS
ncbi:MAG: four helix bundle protein [bacterium]